MTRVRVGELRDRISHYVGRAARGEKIVVLNRTREVAVLGPAPRTGRSGRLYGCLRGTARVEGDIVGAGIPVGEWFRT